MPFSVAILTVLLASSSICTSSKFFTYAILRAPHP
ncbi:hypothetical protein P3T21_004973 [Paraburkholderia sp. GAS334]